MSSSQFCIQQRQKEQQQLRKLLIFGFAGSTVLHGILAYALPRWSYEAPKQAQEPMELILVDKPKPKPKPKQKVESKPIEQPKPEPIPKPEPVQAQTPPPPVKPPKPVQAQTPPPKPAPKPPEPAPTPTPTPAPKKVLTTPTPAPSQPIVSAPVENTAQPSSLSSNFAAPSSSSVTSAESSSSSSGAPGSAVATNNAPPRPEVSSEPSEGISCVSNCEPEYPTALDGVEGSAGIKLTIDKDGNVVGAELADADGNSSVNRQALLAARQMQFSLSSDDAASVQVKIDFTVEGSEYDRARREEQERKEQAAREREEQEAARQQQQEAERQAQQEQLERERQARQEQLEQQQQESTPPPAPQVEPAPKPLPALSPEELDEAMQRGLGGSPHERLHQEERLRKFQERMDNYSEE